MSLDLLRCLGRAIVKNAGPALLRCIPFGEALYDIARDFLKELNDRRQSTAERRQQLETVVNAAPDVIRAEAQRVAHDVAPPEMREPLAQCLEQWPGVIRRSLSRPEDPSGRTAPPKLALDRIEDIVPLLPRKPPRFRPGQQPEGIGNWTLRELLGCGGFAEVWRADNPAGEPAALKFCLEPASYDSLKNEWQLLRQLQTLARGQHGIVRLREEHLAARIPCLVFDYIPGGDLTRLIRCWHESKPQPPRLVWESMRLVGRLAEIVSAAHLLDRPVVHRDLKPTNILLQPSPKEPGKESVRIRVADFGIGGIAAEQALAATFSANEIQTTGMIGAHTDNYAPPQQKEGAPPDPRDDVYALGVVGFQTLMGDTRLVPTISMRDDLADRGVPDSVIGLLKKCLSENLGRRFGNAALLHQAVNDVLMQLPA